MEALSEGRADLALGFVWDVPEAISGEVLYTESFLVAGRADSMPLAPDLTLDSYCATDHILISPAGDLRGVVDDRLEALGLSRRIVLGLPFLPAGACRGSRLGRAGDIACPRRDSFRPRLRPRDGDPAARGAQFPRIGLLASPERRGPAHGMATASGQAGLNRAMTSLRSLD